MSEGLEKVGVVGLGVMGFDISFLYAMATVDFIATEGLKIPRAPLREIDTIGPGAVLQEIEKLSQQISVNALPAPKLLAAMANEGQTFYKNGDTNAWLRSVTEPPNTHARH